jgi:hypothetical protein
MQDVSRPALDAGTIRSMAADVVRIALTPADLDAVRITLASLLDEIRGIAPGDRSGVEPETAIGVEEWPR